MGLVLTNRFDKKTMKAGDVYFVAEVCDSTSSKMAQFAVEAKAKGAYVVAVGPANQSAIKKVADVYIDNLSPEGYGLFQISGHDNRIGLAPEQVSIVLGSNWLISLQEKEGQLLEPVRDRLRNDRGRLRKGGADDLAHALLDGIVDGYFSILDHFNEEIEIVEAALMGRPSSGTLKAIQILKREMILLRKAVWPLREVVGHLSRTDSPLIRKLSVLYFRDISDHTVQVIDTIETCRDMLSGMLDIYLSTLNNRMNEIMKVLTVIATIFMPLTFLAGIYGMNFKYMPELDWRWGYFAAWGVMLVIAVVMLLYFRRKKWL